MKVINSFLGEEYTSSKIRIELDNYIIEADETIADAFNDHFYIVGFKYGSTPTGSQCLKFLKNGMSHLFFFITLVKFLALNVQLNHELISRN